MTRYQDLLTLRRPTFDRRPPMPARNRAAQFAPFAALSGYDDAVEEAGRRTDCRVDISEDRAELLNRRLEWLGDHIAERPTITAVWFVPDMKKAGGEYRIETDCAAVLNPHLHTLSLQNGNVIPLADLYDLQITNLDL